MAKLTSSTDLLAAVRRLSIAVPDAVGQADGVPGSPEVVARGLVRAGILTPFQARRLLAGRGDELRLGTYLLLDRLDAGGMGEVFKARHTVMGRVVVVKLIRADLLTQPGVTDRFLQEIRAVARLSHPHVVAAYHAEPTPRGSFLAMEFCDGRDLWRVVRDDGPPAVGVACGYARQAALGLQHLHDHGLVHRDIKPSNLMLTAAGVKVLDLGLAYLRRAADGSRLTRDGAAMGTPDFVAPEQARDAAGVDIRADLYGLGGTLYYLLTGQVPYPGGTPLEKLLRHQTDRPLPVSQLRRGVPAGVAAVVERLMAKHPADRFQTPAEVVADLAPWVDAPPGSPPGSAPVSGPVPTFHPLPTEPAPPGTDAGLALTLPADDRDDDGTDDRPPPVRRWWLAGAIGAVLVAAVVVGVVAPWDRRPSGGDGGIDPAGPWTVIDCPELAGVNGLAFAPDDPPRVAVAFGQHWERETTGAVRLYDPRAKEWSELPLDEPRRPVRALAFSPDGRHLACGSGSLEADVDGWVTVFDLTGRKPVQRFAADPAGVLALAFPRADVGLLAVGGCRLPRAERGPARREHYPVVVWDLSRTPKQVSWPAGHTGPIGAVVAPSPDLGGRFWLASGSGDGTVRLWPRPGPADPTTRLDLP
ncbi:MAG: protein kinase, partial [Gemmataceae bacterium]|nr:protein kinase [Gemmataceae bacterium]